VLLAGPARYRCLVVRTVAVAVVLVVLGLGAVLLLRPTVPEAPAQAEPFGPVPFSERPAPDQAAPLPDRTLGGFADGPPVALADYRGRPLVVNFWASWCGPCVEEVPAFQQVADALSGRVAFLGVNVSDGPRPAQRFAEEAGIRYDLAIDPDQSFARQVGLFAMPTTLFVDADGMIVHRAATPFDAEGLRAALREHLGVES
jgi:thiol-disulfide isomerase/thioredoxin